MTPLFEVVRRIIDCGTKATACLMLASVSLAWTPASAGSFSCDWTELTLDWPLEVYGNPFHFPSLYTGIEINEQGELIDHEGNAGHNGIDVGTPSFGPTLHGTAQVLAAADGRLVAWRDGLVDRVNGNGDWLAQFTPDGLETVTNVVADLAAYGIEFELDGSGNVVYLQHANGFVTQYAHLAEGIDLLETHALGDWVDAGTVIGVLASSGASSGQHLHFGVHSGPQCRQQFTELPTLPERVGPVGSSWGHFISPDYEEPDDGQRMWVESVPRVYRPRSSSESDLETAELLVQAEGMNWHDDNPGKQFDVIPAGTSIELEHIAWGGRGEASVQVLHASDGNVILPLGDGSHLRDGQTLVPGQIMKSPNDRFIARLESDGRLCVRELGAAVIDESPIHFCSPQPAPPVPDTQLVQGNGNACIVPADEPDSPEPLWCAVSEAPPGESFLTMQSDGNLCLYQGTPDQQGDFIWCSWSNVPPEQSGPIRMDLPAGDYQVRAHRRLQDDESWQLRSELPISVRPTEQLSFTPTWTGNTKGLALGDVFDGSNESRLELGLSFPSVPDDRLIVAIELELRLADPATQGISPFDRLWGATPLLEVWQGDVRVGELAPGFDSGEWLRGWLLFPDQQALSDLPLTLRFNVPHNGNEQSDFIRFDQARMNVHSVNFDLVFRNRFESVD